MSCRSRTSFITGAVRDSEPRRFQVAPPLAAQRVAGRLALAEHALLLALDLVRDAQDLQRLLDGRGVHVDADDALLALLQLLLVGERSLGDLGHEPAVLDAAQDAARHRAIRAH